MDLKVLFTGKSGSRIGVSHYFGNDNIARLKRILACRLQRYKQSQ
jgi:hypothetical protein